MKLCQSSERVEAQMKKCFLVFALSLLTNVAQASYFDGFNLQLGLGGAATTTNVSGFTGMNSNATYDHRNTQGSFNGIVTAGYSKEIPDAYGLNLAANVFYVIGNQNAGSGGKSTNWMNGANPNSDETNSRQKLQNTFGVAIEPGFNFNGSTLGYLKLAWVNSRLNMINSYDLTDPAVFTGRWGEFNQTRTVNGFGYGLGFKKMVSSNMFVGIDAMGVSYGTASFGGNGSIKCQPSQVLGFASIGYRF